MAAWRKVLADLDRVMEGVATESTDRLEQLLLQARRVFLYGLGRSGLVARAFGMRLVHLGRDVTIVGDTTTPAIRQGDLLVICSRTGRSPILKHVLGLAHGEGAGVALITAEPDNELAAGADLVVALPHERTLHPELQPMGSLFEQALLLYLDALVLRLMAATGTTPQDMERVHANLP